MLWLSKVVRKQLYTVVLEDMYYMERGIENAPVQCVGELRMRLRIPLVGRSLYYSCIYVRQQLRQILFLQKGALLKSYNLSDTLQTYHRAGLKVQYGTASCNVTFQGNL